MPSRLHSVILCQSHGFIIFWVLGIGLWSHFLQLRKIWRNICQLNVRGKKCVPEKSSSSIARVLPYLFWLKKVLDKPVCDFCNGRYMYQMNCFLLFCWNQWLPTISWIIKQMTHRSRVFHRCYFYHISNKPDIIQAWIAGGWETFCSSGKIQFITPVSWEILQISGLVWSLGFRIWFVFPLIVIFGSLGAVSLMDFKSSGERTEENMLKAARKYGCFKHILLL